MSDQVLDFNDSDFDAAVVGSDRPVLIDCWAPWCGPCKAMNPVIAEIAAESAGRWRVGKLNIQDNPQTAARLGVRSIPALFFYREGQCRATMIGTQGKQAILDKMNEINA